MIIAGTGHRPGKLFAGMGRDPYRVEHLDVLANTIDSWLMERDEEIRGIISGMALGFDTALAMAAVMNDIPFVAAVPFPGQEMRWPRESRTRYESLLAQAAKVVYVSDGGFAAWKMQRRNEWMVDKASDILTVYDGSSGGTANCIRYAEKVGKKIHHLKWF